MKKTKKVLASLAIAGMVATTVPFNALADTSATTRIFGSDRIQTAIQVAQAGWSTGAATVIVAPSADANLVDALAAAPLAGQDNAPILLTAGSALDPNTKQEIMNLKATKVIAVGALSDQVITDLQSISGVTVQQLKGTDRIDTANKIAAQLTAPAGTFVVGYGALADALSVASYAAANKYEILVANPDGSLPSSEVPVGTEYVIGGPTLVNDGAVPGATRIYGQDRYDTNNQVIQKLGSNFGTVFVANGENAHLVDSLVASAYAAKTGSMIALTDNSTVAATNFLGQKMTSSSNTVALGGTGVVSETIRTSVHSGAIVNPPATGSVTVSSVNLTGNVTVARGEMLAPVGTITLTAGSADATITGLKVTRTGFSSDSDIKGIVAYDGATRLSNAASVSNGVADLGFTTPVVIPAGQSKTIAIKVNVAGVYNDTSSTAKAKAGTQLQFSIADPSAIKTTGTVTGSFPYVSGTMTTADVQIGTLKVNPSADQPVADVNPGTTGVTLTKYDFSPSTEDITLNSITLTNDGTAGDNDITNIKLMDGATQVGSTLTSLTNRTAVFSFPAGIKIANGATKSLALVADIGNSSSGRSWKFDFANDYDLQATGATYGTPIVINDAVSTMTANTINAKPGSLTFSVDSATNPSASTIGANVKQQTFAAIKVQSNGEPVQLQSLTVNANTGYKTTLDEQNASGGSIKTGTLTANTLQNLKITTDDGTVIASQNTPEFNATTGDYDINLSNLITINPSKPVVLTITADTSQYAQPSDQYKLGIDAYTAQTIVTGKDLPLAGDPPMPGVYGNIMTDGAVGVSVAYAQIVSGTDNAFPSEAGHIAGTLNLSTNYSEDVNLNSIRLDGVNTYSDAFNVCLTDTSGNVLTNTIVNPQATNLFTFNTPLKIAKGQTVQVKIKCDITSGATGDFSFTVDAANPLAGVGLTSGNQIVLNPYSGLQPIAGTVQDVVLGAAVSPINGITAKVSSVANLGSSANAQKGQKDVKIAAWTLTNPAAEAVNLKKVWLSAYLSGGLNLADLSNIRVVDGSGNVLATVSNMNSNSAAATDVAFTNAQQKIALTKPLNIGTGNSNTAELAVLADVSGDATLGGNFLMTLTQYDEVGALTGVDVTQAPVAVPTAIKAAADAAAAAADAAKIAADAAGTIPDVLTAIDASGLPAATKAAAHAAALLPGATVASVQAIADAAATAADAAAAAIDAAAPAAILAQQPSTLVGPTVAVTESNVVATSIAIANSTPAPAAGVELGRFTLTNKGTNAVNITQVGLIDLLGKTYTGFTNDGIQGATVELINIDNGDVLGTSTAFTGTNAVTVDTKSGGNAPTLTPGASVNISIIISSPGTTGHSGSGLVAGDGTMLQVDKHTTQYEPSTGGAASSADGSATLGTVSFKAP